MPVSFPTSAHPPKTCRALPSTPASNPSAFIPQPPTPNLEPPTLPSRPQDEEGDEGSEGRGGGDDEEEEGEGFVVDDGYLSGDEGVKLDEGG